MIVRRIQLRRAKSTGSVLALMALAAVALLTCSSVRQAHAQDSQNTTSLTAKETYGRTPSAVTPYRNFREPYVRFFDTTQPFLGTGRGHDSDQQSLTARIGLLAPMGEAPDADLGQSIIDAVTLAVDQANAAGGVNGIPFDIAIREDSGLWGSTAGEMVKFKYEDNVLAVLGSIDGANTHIALRVALKTQVPMINTGTTDPTLTETRIPWIIRCMADDRQQGYALAYHIFATCGIKKIAVLRVNDRFGRMGIGEFRDAARRLKHPLRVELRWNPGDRDFTKQLDRITKSKVDGLVLWGSADDTAAVVRQIRERNMPLRLFGCDRLVSDRFLEQAGQAAEGVTAVATMDPTKSNLRYAKFSEAFSSRFNHPPDSFAAHAYDGANILIESIRQAGLNRVRIRDALHEYQRYAGVTGSIEFDTTLNDVGAVYIATVADGRFEYQPAAIGQSHKEAHANSPYRTLAQAPPINRTPEESADSNATGEIRIGCFLPLDEVGMQAVRGLKMALREDADGHASTQIGKEDLRLALVVRDSRSAWGDDSSGLTSLFADDSVLAVVGSTQRQGTHLMETLAAKLHVPVITLCANDPSIHAIPIPWIFSVASGKHAFDQEFAVRFQDRFGRDATLEAAWGYDAGRMLADAIRSGWATRTRLQQRLASKVWHLGVSGTFTFDSLGRRIDLSTAPTVATATVRSTDAAARHGAVGGERSP